MKIKKINEFCNSTNTLNEKVYTDTYERSFKLLESKLTRICEVVSNDADVILNIWNKTKDMPTTMVQKLNFKNMYIDSRNNALYIDFRAYADKHVLINVYKEGGKNYMTISALVNDGSNEMFSRILSSYDMSSNKKFGLLSNLFKSELTYKNNKIFVNLLDDNYNISGNMESDEFLKLFDDFEKEYKPFIEHLKKELDIL